MYPENFKCLQTDRVLSQSYGRWIDDFVTREQKFSINYSSILTALIQEAGKCKQYASDLFVLWHSVEKELSDVTPRIRYYVFGFRDEGVDPLAFVLTHYHNNLNSLMYRSIYLLTIEVTAAEMYSPASIRMTLETVHYTKRIEDDSIETLMAQCENRLQKVIKDQDERYKIYEETMSINPWLTALCRKEIDRIEADRKLLERYKRRLQQCQVYEEKQVMV